PDTLRDDCHGIHSSPSTAVSDFIHSYHYFTVHPVLHCMVEHQLSNILRKESWSVWFSYAVSPRNFSYLVIEGNTLAKVYNQCAEYSNGRIAGDVEIYI
ncbi:MAG: hypothetical protein FWH42_04020, partial [Dehalococcoidia bacterium]|nr:hypothetical protein [Dehalococcoidia bacterium]